MGGRNWILSFKLPLEKQESYYLNICFLIFIMILKGQLVIKTKEIKPVNLKGNQPWIFTGRTDAETEAPILWPPDGKSWLTGKDPDAGKNWGQEEKGVTEDEMVGWHRWLNGHEFEQTQGDCDVQRSLHFMGSQKCWSQLSDWTTTIKMFAQSWNHTIRNSWHLLHTF